MQRLPVTNGQWYEPGTTRCTYQQCIFTGSKKTVEVHMMDRHLIYPAGWDKRKQRSDWDADPSLKGKPIPILGTGITLDTPEAVEAWLAERRKRFPTATKVQEKEQNLKDAIARGQICLDDATLRGHKRRRHNDAQRIGDNQRGKKVIRTSERVGGRVRGADIGRSGRPMSQETTRPSQVVPPKLSSNPHQMVSVSADSDSDTDSTSGSDMDHAKHAITSKPPARTDPDLLLVADVPMDHQREDNGDIPLGLQDSISTSRPVIGTSVTRQPKKQPFNSFTHRPSLLRNLLLPEIRMTVSNLSQAIRFLVDNDFLEGVELTPGEADKQRIEVVHETNVNHA
ncbi:hypothetical protein BD410DRAFT_712189 [Rickenella mellea]|uniref:FMR1-interacting protein 1 conserved domain-containing protein n=1 Tax=Rickenella mellea TaxID=50990 RepID=A0A4Y7QMM5_9AGAM|nr:hypothetical protein BD410DRAFT_712189 [Rickenella mellea]